jgi:hypothetical protein
MRGGDGERLAAGLARSRSVAARMVESACAAAA